VGSLYDVVADVISGRFNIPREKVQPEASFEDLDLDSLSQIELATALKKQLGFEISDKEISEISLVREVVEALEMKGVNV
jgi:acyl carrier protein